MTLDQFITKYDGKPIDFDHQFGNQCVDLVAQYCVEVLNTQPYYANAADWWNYNDGKFEAKVPISSGQTPQKGDIVIWGHDSPGSGGAGHIDIWLSGDRSNFTGFDQNWPTGSFCHRQSHIYNYIVGWYRPKGEDMPITIEQVDHVLKMGLHREPTASELNNPAYQQSPGLLIDTVWNNGGEANYKAVTGPQDYVPYQLPQLFVKGDKK